MSYPLPGLVFARGKVGGDDDSWNVAQLETHRNYQRLKRDPPWIYFSGSTCPDHCDQRQHDRQNKDGDPKLQAKRCARQETENGE